MNEYWLNLVFDTIYSITLFKSGFRLTKKWVLKTRKLISNNINIDDIEPSTTLFFFFCNKSSFITKKYHHWNYLLHKWWWGKNNLSINMNVLAKWLTKWWWWWHKCIIDFQQTAKKKLNLKKKEGKKWLNWNELWTVFSLE